MDHRSDSWLGLPGTSTEEPSAQSELLKALNLGLIRHFVPFRGLSTLTGLLVLHCADAIGWITTPGVRLGLTPSLRLLCSPEPSVWFQ